MKDTFYQVEIKCKNCKRINWLNKIPMGQELNDFLEETNLRCRFCDCLLFTPKPIKETKSTKEVKEDDD